MFYNSDHRLIPLEVLPMLANVESDVEIFGSGQMTEDDGNADWQGEEAVLEVAPGPVTDAGASGSGAGSSGAGGSSSGGASSSAGAGSSSGAGGSSGSGSAPPEKEGIRLYLGAVKEWMIEFGAGMLFLSIRTDGAWYRLGQPSPQYERWYQPVLKTARLAVSSPCAMTANRIWFRDHRAFVAVEDLTFVKRYWRAAQSKISFDKQRRKTVKGQQSGANSSTQSPDPISSVSAKVLRAGQRAGHMSTSSAANICLASKKLKSSLKYFSADQDHHHAQGGVARLAPVLR